MKMKIKWLKDIELELVADYNEETDIANTEKETVRDNKIDEVDIIQETSDSADIQFGNGSVAFAVPTDCFTITAH